MPEYWFSLTRILPYKDRFRFCADIGKYGPAKTHILTHFTE